MHENISANPSRFCVFSFICSEEVDIKPHLATTCLIETFFCACLFYCSYSGYNDELLWAATWLYLVTKRRVYTDFIIHEAIFSSVSKFNWELKYPDAQILLAEFNITANGGMQNFKAQANNFVCA